MVCMKDQVATIEAIEQLREELRLRDEQIDLLMQQMACREKRISALEQQLKEFFKRMYGKKSEKLDPNQLTLTDIWCEAENSVAGIVPVTKPDAAPEEIVVKSHARRKNIRPPVLAEDLPRVEHQLDIPESEKKCGCCGQAMESIGQDVTERLGYQPVQWFVNRMCGRNMPARTRHALAADQAGTSAGRPVGTLVSGTAACWRISFTGRNSSIIIRSIASKLVLSDRASD